MYHVIADEISEIEALLEDESLIETDRFALYGAQQALRNVLEPDVWATVSKSFNRGGNRPTDPPSKAKD